MTHPHGHVLVLLRDLFPDWRLSVTPDGLWIARAQESGSTVVGMTAVELLDALCVAEPDARDRILDLLSSPGGTVGATDRAEPDVASSELESPGRRDARLVAALVAAAAVGFVGGCVWGLACGPRPGGRFSVREQPVLAGPGNRPR